MRPDDDSKGLVLIDTEDRIFLASNIVCAGECSWIVEKDSGRVFGYGFNSCGQVILFSDEVLTSNAFDSSNFYINSSLSHLVYSWGKWRRN